MKTLPGIALVLLLSIACSNTKTDQLPEKDSVAAGTPDTDTLAKAKPQEKTDSTIQTRIMRWQNVVVDENGTSYEFMDRDGNPFSCMINMPGFDFYNNQY